jgi:ribosomal protein L11 methyltransferase
MGVRVWPSGGTSHGSDGEPSNAGDREALLAALFAHGAAGVHEDGPALVTFFAEGGVDRAALQQSLARADVGARVEITSVEDPDWSHRWRDGISAHAVGRLTVAPPWLAGASDPATTIVIDPGMAFGTGEHESTRGALRLLCGIVRPGDTVADLGAGSGVLSIAAAKLGAARAIAIEIDGDAIANAEANVRRNGVADRVHVIQGDAAALLPLVAPVRIVLANIVSSVLLDLLPVMAKALADDGRAVLGGMLVDERAVMVDALAVAGWSVVEDDIEAGWWSSIVARR